jgi:hypothetical protein
VAPDIFRRAGAERAALVQHRYRRTEIHHKAEIVLDDEECLAGPVELADAVGDLVDEGWIDATGRFVEEEHVGVGHEHICELEQLALPIRQVAGGKRSELRDAHELE